MEKQTQKITQFSKVIYILLKILYITFIAVSAAYVVVWLLSTADLDTKIITINGIEREVPILFKLGNLNVYLPFIWESGFEIQGRYDILNFHLVSSIGFGDLLVNIFTIIGIWHAKAVFKLLRVNGSPFRDEVVKALKKLAIALLLIGAVSGIIPFLAAGIVWVLCLIFDYGRLLQSESDTTL